MEIVEPHVDKLIKSRGNTTRRNRILSRLESIQRQDENKLGIKTTTQHRLNHKLPDRITRKSAKSYISKLGLDTVSLEPIPQPPTKIDLANLKIIHPDKLIIPTMESQSRTISGNIAREDKDKKPTHLGDDYIIVIPSYNRVEMIQKKTLALLQR